jgi:hypothetical protein
MQPTALIRNGRVTHLPQGRGHTLNLGPQSFPNRLPPHDEPVAFLGSPAIMREAQKVEGLWPPFTTPLSVGCGEPPKLDQPRLVGMLRQTERL